jgi:hypothetical protein
MCNQDCFWYKLQTELHPDIWNEVTNQILKIVDEATIKAESKTTKFCPKCGRGMSWNSYFKQHFCSWLDCEGILNK